MFVMIDESRFRTALQGDERRRAGALARRLRLMGLCREESAGFIYRSSGE